MENFTMELAGMDIVRKAQTIKLADLCSNSKSIMQHDPAFAKTYLEEKRLLLAVMTRGDPGLHAEASRYVGAE